MFKFNVVTLAVIACLALAQNANADYFHTVEELEAWRATQSQNFSTLGDAWNPGAATARHSGNPAPGGATWSVMGVGIANASFADSHGSNLTTDLSALYSGGVDEITTIGLTLDKWAAVSGFTNLGMVADGGGLFGYSIAGDIRVGAIFIDGAAGLNTLAHAFAPGTTGSSGFSDDIGGDIHFDNSNTWSDGGAGATIDYHTVALHELGHALGLGHSTVVGSVMEPIYAGSRRTLTADDIAGITAVYGVPEPSVVIVWAAVACGLVINGTIRRRRKQ